MPFCQYKKAKNCPKTPWRFRRKNHAKVLGKICVTIDQNFVFLRGFAREELCFPDQSSSCSSSSSCSNGPATLGAFSRTRCW
jgi:hypothetical protein